jgi:hypothetical protein
MKTYTFKIVYYLPPEKWNNGIKGVAFVEGYDRSHAISAFQQLYRGQFSTIDTCEKMC